jgi:hypothetical protein
MAGRHERPTEPEASRARFTLIRCVLAIVGVWLAFRALGSVLSMVRHVVGLVVLVLVIVGVGWCIARARKS